MGLTTNYKDSAGVDIGNSLVEKSYLLDRYPELTNTYRFAGLWGVGIGNLGALGTGNTLARSSPVQTIAGGTNWKQVSCGYAAAAIKTDGTLWTWGYATQGTLGDGTSAGKSSPVQTIAQGTNWKQVSSAADSMAAIKTDGTLWLWGNANDGKLGDSTQTSKSSPVQTIAQGTNWKQVSIGTYHAAAVKTDGTLWTWGGNLQGNLGDGTSGSFTQKSSPVQTIAQGTNWKQVSVGGNNTAAIKTDGTLWTWGARDAIGDNTSIGKSSPVQTVSGGTNWKQVSVGDSHAAAIKTDGTLWTWGRLNTYGQLGDGTSAAKSSPVQTIAQGTNWKQVSASYDSTYAIKTDGTLWGWGNNLYGQLGNNTTSHQSSPVQTIAQGTNWVSLGNLSYNNLLAIRDDSNDLI